MGVSRVELGRGEGGELTVREMTVCDPNLAQHIPKPLYRANGPSLATSFPRQSKALRNCLDLSCINRTFTVSKGALVTEQARPATIDAEKCRAKPSDMRLLDLRMLLTWS